MNQRVSKLTKSLNVVNFQQALIQWYLEEKRDLPWRREKDPYKIWVSEIMLQQTRVDTVIPYFNRFIEKYPTIKALAEADEQEVLKMWEGLGYYSRVKNLHQAVREVQKNYGGIVPEKKEEFSQLKGVGPYTTGAVLSIAYGKPIPAVDGNVMRVFSRIFNIHDDISKSKTRKLFEELTTVVISHEDPGSFNQAIMDLGATICTPKNPACLLCPVREFCQAYHEGTQHDLPVKSKQKKGKTVRYVTAVLIDQEGNVAIRQRPDEGLLASLWEFPNVEISSRTKNMVTHFEKEMRKQYELHVELEEPLTMIEHIFLI